MAPVHNFARQGVHEGRVESGRGAKRTRSPEGYGNRDNEIEIRNKRQNRDSYEGRNSGYNRDYRHGNQDLLKDRERERRYSYSRHTGREEKHYSRENDRKRDRERDKERDTYMGRSRKSTGGEKENSSRKVYIVEEEKNTRVEDEEKDYQEKIMLQLAEQEEEDLNRIKEESRKILEKYKVKQSPQQCQTPINDTIKEYTKQLSQARAGTDIVIEETVDDIFGDSPIAVRKPGRGVGLAIENGSVDDNRDDAEGYYGYLIDEILDARYKVIAARGKGVFSTVVHAEDHKAESNDPKEVAIKIIRSNETMYKAGMDETAILKKLRDADPKNERCCVRFISSFKHKNHLCLVFESLQMDLRQVLKKFGRNIGLKLDAVREYAKQLFIALKHLEKCHVLHCDIKPDNILVNEDKNVLKLCDFGSAMFDNDKNERTPYLVSRFYRAPEVILGLPYHHPMDMWSVGCCLFELYSGKFLFPGQTNHAMLRLHMELLGPFPKKAMLKKGVFVDQHFDEQYNFLALEENPVTKKRLVLNIKSKDMGSVILSSPGEDPKMLSDFRDLMKRIFVLDPKRRITASEALSHRFITGYLSVNGARRCNALDA